MTEKKPYTKPGIEIEQDLCLFPTAHDRLVRGRASFADPGGPIGPIIPGDPGDPGDPGATIPSAP